MSDFSDITSLSLGNTFGAWYSKTNDIITRINALDVGSLTGGDGILALKDPSVAGGYTLGFSGSVTRNTTFGGNVTVLGTLSYGSLNSDITSTQLTLPYSSGVTIGNVVYLNENGFLQKAKADDECTSEVVGVVTSITGPNAIVATTGKISGASMAQMLTGVTGATFIKGAVYFLSAGISGAGVTTEPSISSYVSKPVVLGLTSDAALILPYRGFIANGGLCGGSTTILGYTGGVISVNGVSAALNNISGTLPNVQITRRTKGNIYAVTQVNGLSVDVNVSFGGSSKNFGTAQLFDSMIAISGSQTDDPGPNGTTIRSINTIDSSTITSFFPLFGTIGGITATDYSDVYKLHKIRIISKSVPSSIIAIPFSLYRIYHRYSGTNYLKTKGLDDGANQAAGEQHIEMKMKECDITITLTKYTSTFSKELLTPVLYQPYLNSSSGGDGITSGNSSGTLDSAAPYPVFYGLTARQTLGGTYSTFESYRALFNRTYAWNFNSVIMNGPYISEYINAAVTGNDANIGSPAGYTMDSSILGWNAQFGATPETIFINFPSLADYYRTNTTSSQNTEIQVILELYKINPITGISGPIMAIPTNCDFSLRAVGVRGSVPVVTARE